jgi:hypothetical protein
LASKARSRAIRAALRHLRPRSTIARKTSGTTSPPSPRGAGGAARTSRGPSWRGTASARWARTSTCLDNEQHGKEFLMSNTAHAVVLVLGLSTASAFAADSNVAMTSSMSADALWKNRRLLRHRRVESRDSEMCPQCRWQAALALAEKRRSCRPSVGELGRR